MRDLGLLIMRLVVGGLLAGHGAQKLFGWFGGHGPKGTGGWLESLHLRPGHYWAYLAGMGEFGGGVLTALGLLHPAGPLTILGPMAVATGIVHAGKPIWASEGGAELPVTNMAVGLGLALAGPGRFSMDRIFGIKMPVWVRLLMGVAVLLGIGATFMRRELKKMEMEREAAEQAMEAKLVQPQTDEEIGHSAA